MPITYNGFTITPIRLKERILFRINDSMFLYTTLESAKHWIDFLTQ